MEEVASGLLSRSRPGLPLFEMSTNSPTLARRLHTRFVEKGMHFLDAPISGGAADADPVYLWQAIRQGSVGRRRSCDGLVDEFLPGSYDNPSAALRIVHKDMMVATELGRELDVPLRFASLALADIMEAMNRGWSERDARGVTLLPQERAGVTIAEERARIDAVPEADPSAPTDRRRGR